MEIEAVTNALTSRREVLEAEDFDDLERKCRMNGLPRVKLTSRHDLSQTAPVTDKLELVEKVLACEETKIWAHLRS